MASPTFDYHLTVIDLPGLFPFGDDEKQTEDGVAFANSLVTGYITRPNIVVLAMVRATQETGS